MRRFTKLLAVLLSLTMCLSLLPVFAFAEEEASEEETKIVEQSGDSQAGDDVQDEEDGEAVDDAQDEVDGEAGDDAQDEEDGKAGDDAQIEEDAPVAAAAPRRMAARAARAPLNVDHSKAEQSASEENPGTEEPKKTAVDAYVNLPSNVTPKEEWRHTQNSWYSTGMIEIPSSELTEDRKGSGSFVLKNPVVVDLDEEAGTKIYYTRIAWVGGRWHLDGVVTEQVKNFCVASIQDKTETKVYGSEAGVTAKWDDWFNFTPDELSALNEAINESGVDLPRGYNWNFLKNDNRLPPVPESVKKAATKILQRKGWKAGDDAIRFFVKRNFSRDGKNQTGKPRGRLKAVFGGR